MYVCNTFWEKRGKTMLGSLRRLQNTLSRPENDQGHGGTHSANRKSTRDVAEHTLPTGNRSGTWRNTLCWLEINLGRGGTHSTDRKPTMKRDGTHTADWKSTRDMAEHTLQTGNWPNTGGTHSANQKLTRDMVEHTLLTENWPGKWRNTLWRTKINPGRVRTHSAKWKLLIMHSFISKTSQGTATKHSPAWLYARDLQAQGACALRFFT